MSTRARAAGETENSRGPVYEGVMECEPLMAEVYGVGSELGDAELDGFVMVSYRHV